ncbi:MARVEL-like domain protein [Metarhizium album ARSEF 1941]|uniref:MARVEL-like domain protein n=1 Tax=Metarhizium album (strain ARSEF 1941) TaxID=1081103 RepID=A0A0B2WP63_METAS|nr:MARVEL-like domain protein [Metarhizium album ARSEF 1941]KHN95464.1 MARVEL-like domain protein [Metarhizium album ARSEF 1941]
MEIPGPVKPALLGAIALLDLGSLGLLAYVVYSWSGDISYGWGYTRHFDSPSQVNFMLFNTIWTILVLVYLGVFPRFLKSLYKSIAALALLAISTVLWLVGSIVLAVFLGASNCNVNAVCGPYRSAQAATAFGFAIWAMFTVLSVLELLALLKSGFSFKFKKGAKPGSTGNQRTSQTA